MRTNKQSEETEYDHIVTYCNSEIKRSFKLIQDPYWTNKVYSLGKHLREYGYYPSWLPLCVYNDHGVSCDTQKPYNHELESDAPFHLVHSPDSKSEWEKYSKKKCFVMFSPFVFYRRKHNVLSNIKAKGTIAFPAHTTPEFDDISDIEIYINQLINLPKHFHPISVCLHMHDINRGRHVLFKKYNIQVYTAGNCYDDRFAERFYDIIKKFKYATSNLVGSYLYYCVEMGIPFFIHGSKQVYINNGDKNFPDGLCDPYDISKGYRDVYDMFSGFFTEISPTQKKHVEKTLGLNEGISRGRMAVVLYFSLFKWIISGTFIRYAHIFFQNLVKNKFIKK